jgi:uncharacterized protein YbjT (DUF2867 family)
MPPSLVQPDPAALHWPPPRPELRMSRTVLVAGATGMVGTLLLRQLAAGNDYAEVRVFGRRPPAQEHPKFRFVATDFNDLDQHAGALAADDVFCCLGTTLRQAGSRPAFERVDFHMVVDLARAARKAGARRFLVVSSAGASERSPAFYSRVKGRMERAVAAVGFEAVHIVRPSLLLGERTERRPGERLAQFAAPLLSPLLAGPLKKYRAVGADAVADALVQLARSPGTGVHVHHLPLQ